MRYNLNIIMSSLPNINLTRLLQLYYCHVFPFAEIYNWLGYGSNEAFQRREFSFVLDKDEFQRYRVYKDQEELAIRILQGLPRKISIGPIYNRNPSYAARKQSHEEEEDLAPAERELIFDIDLNDYDDVRSCCTGPVVCHKCWKFIVIACKILHTSLTEDFGYEKILWVFSGRRGIHIWVCDPSARILSDKQRTAIVKFFHLVQRGTARKKVTLKKMHPSIQRALEMIDPIFVSLAIDEQKLLCNVKSIKRFLTSLPETLQDEVKFEFQKCKNGRERWSAFEKIVKAKIASNALEENKYIVEEIKLLYCYPRLDMAVTKAMNHLLRLPFSMHPDTKKISIPFDINEVDKFDPINAPTVHLLLREIKCDIRQRCQYDIKNPPNYTGTSLHQPIRLFREFLSRL